MRRERCRVQVGEALAGGRSHRDAVVGAAQARPPQERFAELAGIHRTYVASLEAGMRNPSLELMAKLANALGIDLAELTRGLQAINGRDR